MQTVKNRLIHVFTRDFADVLLSELDTVSDFCEYLRKKEAIDKSKMIVVLGGEENLLANYLEHGRDFSWMDNYDNIMIDDTVWPAFSSKPQFLAKKRENRISYGWDHIIDRAHDGLSAAYERAARELARPDRFSRRVLSKSFLEAYKEYLKSSLPIFRRMMPLGDTTYCFLFMEDGNQLPRKRRTGMLGAMCFVARGLPPMNKRVIGIATERENRSYDYCVRVQPEWTAEHEAAKIQIQKDTGIFVRPRLMRGSEDDWRAIISGYKTLAATEITRPTRRSSLCLPSRQPTNAPRPEEVTAYTPQAATSGGKTTEKATASELPVTRCTASHRKKIS